MKRKTKAVVAWVPAVVLTFVWLFAVGGLMAIVNFLLLLIFVVSVMIGVKLWND